MSPLTGLFRLDAPRSRGRMIFSGQEVYEAQSQNCETEKTHARSARKTSGDSGGLNILGNPMPSLTKW